MDTFSFRVGIESVIKFDDAHPIFSEKVKLLSSPNINLISHDPIKSLFNLDKTLEWRLMKSIKPDPYSTDSLLNSRSYNATLREMLKSLKDRKKFSNLKSKKIWDQGVEVMSELDDLQEYLTMTIAREIEV